MRENPRLERALMLIELPPDLNLTPYITLTAITRVETASTAGLEPGRVLISSQRSDRRWAQRLRESLATLGWSVYLDVGTRPGEDQQFAVADAIATVDGVVVVIGPSWVAGLSSEQGAWARRELEYAVHISEERGLGLIPVLVDGAEHPTPSDLPAGLERMSYLNSLRIEETYYTQAIARLDDSLRALSKDLEARRAPGGVG